jgi:hypothetical protein
MSTPSLPSLSPSHFPYPLSCRMLHLFLWKYQLVEGLYGALFNKESSLACPNRVCTPLLHPLLSSFHLLCFVILFLLEYRLPASQKSDLQSNVHAASQIRFYYLYCMFVNLITKTTVYLIFILGTKH